MLQVSRSGGGGGLVLTTQTLKVLFLFNKPQLSQECCSTHVCTSAHRCLRTRANQHELHTHTHTHEQLNQQLRKQLYRLLFQPQSGPRSNISQILFSDQRLLVGAAAPQTSPAAFTRFTVWGGYDPSRLSESCRTDVQLSLMLLRNHLSARTCEFICPPTESD